MLCCTDCSGAATESKIRSLTPAGATPLFDSLAFSASYIAERHRPGVRQVLILLSDGNDTISGSSLRQALDAVIGTGALLYTINPNKTARDVKGSLVLQELAEATGGRSFPRRTTPPRSSSPRWPTCARRTLSRIHSPAVWLGFTRCGFFPNTI